MSAAAIYARVSTFEQELLEAAAPGARVHTVLILHATPRRSVWPLSP